MAETAPTAFDGPSLALIVGALLAVVLASALRPRLHAGVLALAIVAATGSLVEAFPTGLFVTLLGVTTFTSFLHQSGALNSGVSRLVARLPRAPGALALAAFAAGAVLTATGLGNIPTVALLAPLAFPLARAHGASPTALAIALIGGANATALAPFSLAGVIVLRHLSASDLAARAGTSPGLILAIIAATTFVALAAATALGWMVLSGRARIRSALPTVKTEQGEQGEQEEQGEQGEHADRAVRLTPLTPEAHGTQSAQAPSANDALRQERIRLLLVASALVAALVLGVDLGVASWVACAAALLVSRTRAEDALTHVPLGTLLLVCGMSALVTLAESYGLREAVSRLAGEDSVGPLLSGAVGTLAGALSAFSSSTGVVLPLFLPIVDGLASDAPAAFHVAMHATLAAGSHLVDASPYSTLGALCLAACAPGHERERTHTALLWWGLAMIPCAGLIGVALGAIALMGT